MADQRTPDDVPALRTTQRPPGAKVTDRCEWSDLKHDECAHCGANPGSNIVLEQPRATLLADIAVARPARRRLPFLGSPDASKPPEFQDMVDELTRAHGHRESYTLHRSGEVWNGQHITEVPALVHQLLGSTPAGSKDEAGAGAAKSKPAARIEAIDTLMLIDDEAERWLARLGDDVPGDRMEPGTDRPIPGSGTIAAIIRVGSHHRSARDCRNPRPHYPTSGGRPDCCHRHQLEHDIRRWWHQARVISGWDSPAYRPFNTCPVCEQRGALRINLVMRAGFCVECRTVWTADDIGLLAEHIRTENLEDDVAEAAS